jgi:hypothetical protein
MTELIACLPMVPEDESSNPGTCNKNKYFFVKVWSIVKSKTLKTNYTCVLIGSILS